MSLRLVVISPVIAYRKDLLRVLRNHGTIAVVGVFTDALEVSKLPTGSVDLILVDAQALEAATTIAVMGPAIGSARVLALEYAGTAEEVVRCVRSGVHGILVRDASLNDIIAAVHQIDHGAFPVPTWQSAMQVPPTLHLTRREQHIAHLVAKGMTNRRIASELKINESTVRNHVHNILQRLGLSRRTQLIALIWERSRETRVESADPEA